MLRTAPGGRDTVTGVPREPTSPGTGSAQRARTSSSPPGPARLSLRCWREELGRECGDVTGRGRGPAGRPEVASQRPQEGGSKTAAKPEGPGGRDSAPTPCQSAHFQDARTPHSSDPPRGEADWTKWPPREDSPGLGSTEGLAAAQTVLLIQSTKFLYLNWADIMSPIIMSVFLFTEEELRLGEVTLSLTTSLQVQSLSHPAALLQCIS